VRPTAGVSASGIWPAESPAAQHTLQALQEIAGREIGGLQWRHVSRQIHEGRCLDPTELLRRQGMERGSEEFAAAARDVAARRDCLRRWPRLSGAMDRRADDTMPIVPFWVHSDRRAQPAFPAHRPNEPRNSDLENDPLVKSWKHAISIKPLGQDRSIYRDVIDIDAGRLTVLVWAWVNWFYRHRQRRWRAFAKTLRTPGL
jgi:hypothetical protein